MDAETRQEFKILGEDIRAVHTKIDDQREDYHKLELAVQETGTHQPRCREQMEPRMLAIEQGKQAANQRTWEIVKPILTRAIEVAVFAIIFASYLYMKNKGMLP